MQAGEFPKGDARARARVIVAGLEGGILLATSTRIGRRWRPCWSILSPDLAEPAATDVGCSGQRDTHIAVRPGQVPVDSIVIRKATPLGYIEAKDVGADLARVENSEQLTEIFTSP